MSNVHLGVVTNTNDPDKLGRVQVELGMPYDEPVPVVTWLRVLQPMATKEAGLMWLPEVGDEVLLLRNDAGTGEPFFVIGSLYNGTNKPCQDAVPTSGKEKDAKQNFVKQFKTKTGHEVTLVDEKDKESITIKTGDGKLSLLMDMKAGAITITSDKEVNVKAPNGKLVIEAKEAELSGSSTVSITGGSSSISVAADTKLELKGGGGKIELSGGMVKLG
jgi:uncharacterized protein involved in type VI secretion and phage assembly